MLRDLVGNRWFVLGFLIGLAPYVYPFAVLPARSHPEPERHRTWRSCPG